MLKLYRYFYRIELFTIVFLSAVCLLAPGEASGVLPAGMNAADVTITKKVNTYDNPENALYREQVRKGGGGSERNKIDANIGYIIADEPDAQGVIYRFDGAVQVLLANGQKSTMDELPMPCQAKLYYYPNTKTSPFLYKIVVLSVARRANTSWSADFKK